MHFPGCRTPCYAHIRGVLGLGSLSPWVTFLAPIPQPYSRSCFASIRLPEHPCPNHSNFRVPRADGHQSIHAAAILSFVFPEQTVTMVHPCRIHSNVRVPRAYGHQSNHAQTIITSEFLEHMVHAASIMTFVFLDHTVTRASMPKLY